MKLLRPEMQPSAAAIGCANRFPARTVEFHEVTS